MRNFWIGQWYLGAGKSIKVMATDERFQNLGLTSHLAYLKTIINEYNRLKTLVECGIRSREGRNNEENIMSGWTKSCPKYGGLNFT